MKNYRRSICCCAVAATFGSLMGCAGGAAWSAEDREQVVEELIERAAADQEIRSADVSVMSSADRSEFFERASRIDKENTAWVKELVETHGWPTVGRVGKEASQGAFLIVQHADHDPEFQAYCLPILEQAAGRGEIPMSNVALLTDRVRVKQRLPQLYGTQYHVRELPDGSAVADEDGNFEYLLPIVEDVSSLDKRRREAGLQEWAEYELQMAQLQGREPARLPRSWDGNLPVNPQG